MKYDVWYMRPEWVPTGILGLAAIGKDEMPDPTNLTRTHILLATIDARHPEHAFNMMQGEAWSPNGEGRPLIEGKGLTHTSMCVGDILHCHTTGETIMVNTYGFVRLQPGR